MSRCHGNRKRGENYLFNNVKYLQIGRTKNQLKDYDSRLLLFHRNEHNVHALMIIREKTKVVIEHVVFLFLMASQQDSVYRYWVIQYTCILILKLNFNFILPFV